MVHIGLSNGGDSVEDGRHRRPTSSTAGIERLPDGDAYLRKRLFWTDLYRIWQVKGSVRRRQSRGCILDALLTQK